MGFLYDSNKKQPKMVISTGFQPLDRILNDGLQSGGLYLIASPSQFSRRMLLHLLVRSVAKNRRKPVVHILFEKTFEAFKRRVSERSRSGWKMIFADDPPSQLYKKSCTYPIAAPL